MDLLRETVLRAAYGHQYLEDLLACGDSAPLRRAVDELTGQGLVHVVRGECGHLLRPGPASAAFTAAGRPPRA